LRLSLGPADRPGRARNGTRACPSAYGTSAPIGRITSFSAKFTDAPLAEEKFETYLHERENAKKPRAVTAFAPPVAND
jgi:hypothetical protein